MKIKIFDDRDIDRLEKEINDYIDGKEIIDIKLTTTGMPRYTVIVMHK